MFFLLIMVPRHYGATTTSSARGSPLNPNGKIDRKALVRMLDENVLTGVITNVTTQCSVNLRFRAAELYTTENERYLRERVL